MFFGGLMPKKPNRTCPGHKNYAMTTRFVIFVILLRGEHGGAMIHNEAQASLGDIAPVKSGIYDRLREMLKENLILVKRTKQGENGGRPERFFVLTESGLAEAQKYRSRVATFLEY